jgi:hypothetical protein
MIRVVIENIVLFLLPTAIYVIYILLTRKQDEQGRGVLDDAPFIWLMLSGTALVFLVLIAFGSTSGGKPGQHYTPPSLGTDGKIDPGKLD